MDEFETMTTPFGNPDAPPRIIQVGDINGHEVWVSLRMGWVATACAVHPLDYWERNWKRVAFIHGVSVDDKQVAELFEKIKTVMGVSTK